jgi:hypothetical protein
LSTHISCPPHLLPTQGTPAAGGIDETGSAYEAGWPAKLREKIDDTSKVTRLFPSYWTDFNGAPHDSGGSIVCWEREMPVTQAGSKVGLLYPSTKVKINGKDVTLRQALFASHPCFQGKDPTMCASHLCHNRACVRPNHIVYEPDFVNKGRSGCAGGRWCLHYTRCLWPGEASFGS